jgi:hypothetical protein
MPDGPSPGPDPSQPTDYQIRVRGHLDDRSVGAFDGLTATRETGGDTVLTVPVADQAALHGLLRKLRDLGVSLVSINPAGSDLPGISPNEEKQR